MIRKLIERPIAVTMVVIAVLVLGIVSVRMLPVSLMPEVDIPLVTVRCSLPGASAREMDETVVKPLRAQLVQTTDLSEMQCEARNGTAVLELRFAHGTRIDYVFMEVNEKIDQVLGSLPAGMERPKAIKASATDIPVFFIDVVRPGSSDERFIELSSFVQEVIRKRLEQVPQIAMVDVSGTLGSRILVEPDEAKLRALGKEPSFLGQVLSDNEIRLGSATIRDGHYRWTVSFDNEIRSAADIASAVTNVDGRIYRLSDLARIRTLPAEATGIVRSDGEKAVTLAVIKESDARMEDLDAALDDLMDQFAADYPDLRFSVSRNQTELLEYSIGNLKDNVLIGALLAVLVIFLFLRDFKSPLLVTVTIPLSLVVTLLLLYVIGISINIISLSGLILGIGMMVDNSIIVIDNITQYRERGLSLREAAVRGTGEVIAPMLSSVLTTCSVFVPLIFLSGMAGALFYDQAMGVTVGLFSSLAVAVLVIPVYYVVLYRKQPAVQPAKRNLIDYDAIYETGLKWFFRHPGLAWGLFVLFIPLSAGLYLLLDKSELPPLTRDDTLMTVDWNEPVSVEENDRRITEILRPFRDRAAYLGTMSGTQDFLLSHTEELSESRTQVYAEVARPADLAPLETDLRLAVLCSYPAATVEFSESSSIFSLIFSGRQADLVARVRNGEGSVPGPDELTRLTDRLQEALPGIRIEPVLWQEQILLTADPEKMARYGVSYDGLVGVLRNALRRDELTVIKSGSRSVPVILAGGAEDRSLFSLEVTGRVETDRGPEQTRVPVSVLLQEHRIRDLKTIVSGKDGDFYPVSLELGGRKAPEVMRTVRRVLEEAGNYTVSFSGGWFDGRKMIRELSMVLLVSLLLLFFILAAQFESLVQPFIILSEIVVDLFGAFLLLWIGGSGINLMSMIGIVVMCGIIINDSILKVDSINRLRREGCGLLRAILTAGKRRLKPILMTSLTTILAIAPFLVRGDMGSDLQYPLSLALIGGMLLGTLVSIFYIPLFYYEIYRRPEARTRAARREEM